MNVVILGTTPVLASVTFTGTPPVTPPANTPFPTAKLQEWDAVGKAWVADAAGKDLVVPALATGSAKKNLFVASFPGLPFPALSGDYLLTLHDPTSKVAFMTYAVPVPPACVANPVISLLLN